MGSVKMVHTCKPDAQCCIGSDATQEEIAKPTFCAEPEVAQKGMQNQWFLCKAAPGGNGDLARVLTLAGR